MPSWLRSELSLVGFTSSSDGPSRPPAPATGSTVAVGDRVDERAGRVAEIERLAAVRERAGVHAAHLMAAAVDAAELRVVGDEHDLLQREHDGAGGDREPHAVERPSGDVDRVRRGVVAQLDELVVGAARGLVLDLVDDDRGRRGLDGGDLTGHPVGGEQVRPARLRNWSFRMEMAVAWVWAVPNWPHFALSSAASGAMTRRLGVDARLHPGAGELLVHQGAEPAVVHGPQVRVREHGVGQPVPQVVVLLVRAVAEARAARRDVRAPADRVDVGPDVVVQHRALVVAPEREVEVPREDRPPAGAVGVPEQVVVLGHRVVVVDQVV